MNENPLAVNTSKQNTLDSFVIKQEPSRYFDEPVLKTNEPKQNPLLVQRPNTNKRTQTKIDDYMFPELKASGKRLKKS